MHMNYLKRAGIEGKPPILNDEKIDKLKECILVLHTTQTYLTYPTIEEIYVFIVNNFKKYLNHDTMRKK